MAAGTSTNDPRPLRRPPFRLGALGRTARERLPAQAGLGPLLDAEHLCNRLSETTPAAQRVHNNAFDGRLHDKTLGWEFPIALAIRASAQQLGIHLIPGFLERNEEADYRSAFGAMANKRVDAVLFTEAAEHFTHRRLIVELAEAHKLPTITTFLEVVEIGGLIAYAPDRREPSRCLATCIDKVLRGENPAEIPIYRAVKFVPRHKSQGCESARPLSPAVPRCRL